MNRRDDNIPNNTFSAYKETCSISFNSKLHQEAKQRCWAFRVRMKGPGY